MTAPADMPPEVVCLDATQADAAPRATSFLDATQADAAPRATSLLDAAQADAAPRAAWLLGALCRACLVAAAASGCGDNLPGEGPALAMADTLVVIAHLDDDLIFMQPEIHAAVASGSVTTVYVSSGDPVKGDDNAEHTFEAAMMAYAAVAGSSDWDCGYQLVAGSPVHHCRLRDRPVSMIGLDTADGAPDGQYVESPLHLVENLVPSISILGPIRGRATVDSITASLAELITATAPAQIHTLDLAATHGEDHSGHLFAATFALWGAARARYDGPIRWHRGYNVDGDAINLSDADYALVKPMLGYFEACYFGCGPCGTSCATLVPGHDTDVRRQYSSLRSPLDAQGALALEGTGPCVTATAAGELVLGACSGAAMLQLDPAGHLALGDRCLASPPSNGDPVVLEPCQDIASQYWVIDSDGMVWNGRPPVATANMAFDHVRCLAAAAATGAPATSPITAPICGAHLHPHWRFVAGP